MPVATSAYHVPAITTERILSNSAETGHVEALVPALAVRTARYQHHVLTDVHDPPSIDPDRFSFAEPRQYQ